MISYMFYKQKKNVKKELNDDNWWNVFFNFTEYETKDKKTLLTTRVHHNPKVTKGTRELHTKRWRKFDL